MKLISFWLLLFILVLFPFSSFATEDSAIFAGGCFWCVEADFDKVPGVIKTISGYEGGHVVNPSYQQVSAGGTGHYEAVEVFFDPTQVSYEKLLDVFWHNIDPTDANGQFCDKGQQYGSAIFYKTETQHQLAAASKEQLLKSGRFKTIATEIKPATPFYPAEEYHQKYYIKNPIRYQFYRYSCGRDQRLEELWGKK